MFGALLTAGDHKARMDRCSTAPSTKPAHARRPAPRREPGRARQGTHRRQQEGRQPKALLDAVPRELHSDPGYMFARIQLLRREDKFAEAAQLMLTAPNDPEPPAQSRRMVDRAAAAGAQAARRRRSPHRLSVARDAALPARDIYKTEQEFTAGWIALRFLNDPATAAQHFARIGVGSANPTALARGGYWQGRAAEALGRSQEARAAYQAGRAHSTSYYGQLARAKLGLPQIALDRRPAGRGRGRSGWRSSARWSCSTHSTSASSRSRFSPTWATTSIPTRWPASPSSPSRNSDARGMLLLGKAALNRGLPFDHYAYPVIGMPKFKPIGPEVEPGIVYSIARQESAFNPAVVRRRTPRADAGDAGRRPLCRQAVRRHLRPQAPAHRPGLQRQLGAAELGDLLEDYRGSYIMAFAGLQCRPRPRQEWIERYGDPRDPKVDPVDWVERIPFSETRNYVQRIMENVQVYRARFGGGSRLQIEADLQRGASVCIAAPAPRAERSGGVAPGQFAGVSGVGSESACRNVSSWRILLPRSPNAGRLAFCRHAKKE